MRNKTEHDRFPIVKRGYEPAAVETYLDAIAAETDATLDEAAQQIVALQGQVDALRSNEEAVHLTIMAATETKENMLAAAREQADALRNEGRKAGDAVITEARMQAFQLVTEARKEAQEIVAEAMAEAATISRASELDVEVPNTSPNTRELELESRIAEMQNVIAEMEAQLRSQLPTPARRRPEPAAIDEEALSAPGDDGEDSGEDEPETVAPVVEEHIEIVVTDSVAVETDSIADATEAPPAEEAPVDDSDAEDDRVTAVRRSFYSRRSAKLPRIGAEAGKGAMAAMAGLRGNLDAPMEPDAAAAEDSEEQEQELEKV